MREIVSMNSNSDWNSLEQNWPKPDEAPVMTQNWTNLLFSHAPIDPEVIAKHLPPGLSLETYDHQAWIGFVPFQMQRVRFSDWRRIYPQPDFLETNLRTYVRHPVHGSGVWFFSLDASAYLPCLAARISFGLPYLYSGLAAAVNEVQIAYYGTRTDRQRLPGVYEKPSRGFRYTAEFQRGSNPELASARSLDQWLLERYRLFSADAKGNIMTARVWHEPYKVTTPVIEKLSIETDDPRFQNLSFQHHRFCPGVRIQAFKPERVS